MKVLVATKHGQGQRKTDFCHTDQHELVTFPTECDGERIDGRCGCRRCMVGMTTGKTTTTMVVIDDPAMTKEKYREAILKHMRDCGWDTYLPPAELQAVVDDDTDILAGLAETFPVGLIVERRGKKFQTRLMPDT